MKKRLLTVLVTGTVLTLGALAPKVSAQDFDSQINSVNSTIANIYLNYQEYKLRLMLLKLKKLKLKQRSTH